MGLNPAQKWVLYLVGSQSVRALPWLCLPNSEFKSRSNCKFQCTAILVRACFNAMVLNQGTIELSKFFWFGCQFLLFVSAIFIGFKWQECLKFMFCWFRSLSTIVNVLTKSYFILPNANWPSTTQRIWPHSNHQIYLAWVDVNWESMQVFFHSLCSLAA